MFKIPLPKWGIDLAYKFVDLEADGRANRLENRVYEYSFVLPRIIRLEAGRLLDIGCVARMNMIPAVICDVGWLVWGIDTRDYRYEHCNFEFIKGDIRGLAGFQDFFDVVTAVSTIEHIGIRGRYGVKDRDKSGDIKAIDQAHRILKSGGKLLLTLPTGEKTSITNLEKIYAPQDVRTLLSAWDITYFESITNDGDSTLLVEATKI